MKYPPKTTDDWKEVDEKLEKHGFTYTHTEYEAFRFYKHKTFDNAQLRAFGADKHLCIDFALSKIVETDFVFVYKSFYSVKALKELDQPIFQKDYQFILNVLNWLRDNPISIPLPDDLGTIETICLNPTLLKQRSLIDRVKIEIDRNGIHSPVVQPKGQVDIRYYSHPVTDRAELRFWKGMEISGITSAWIKELYQKTLDWSSDPENIFRKFCQAQLNIIDTGSGQNIQDERS